MANLKEIRIRIGSVKNTRKITSAMSRIASARLSRAQAAMDRSRAYGERMRDVVSAAVAELETGTSHPMLDARAEVKRVGIIVVNGDRGLCGGFNTQANRMGRRLLHEAEADGRQGEIYCVGKKATAFFAYEGITAARSWAAPTPETAVDTARTVAAEVGTAFAAGELDEVRLVFNYFKNIITQEVQDEQVLPVVPVSTAAPSEVAPADAEGVQPVRKFEPSVEALLETLLPVALETQLQRAMFNSAAAELAARRQAMDSATDNASELIKELTLIYNRERQAAITKELMEIVGGAEALKG
jgi:F-type H+-transporting ATPase subunit gamma